MSLADIDAVFVFDAATSVAALVLLRGVRLRTADQAQVPMTSLAEIRAGLDYSYTHRPVATVMYLGSLSWLAFGVFIASLRLGPHWRWASGDGSTGRAQ